MDSSCNINHCIRHNQCWIAILLAILCSQFTPVNAGITPLTFSNDEIERDYKELIAELRCLVCQNQNLADSNAELASDLRSRIHEMLHQGNSKSEIVQFMVARYGDFVRYRPPLQLGTLSLWLGPFVMLLAGLWVLFRLTRKQAPVRTNAGAGNITEES